MNDEYLEISKDFRILRKYGIKEVNLDRYRVKHILDIYRDAYGYLVSDNVPYINEIDHIFIYGVKVTWE
jgi:hypothetical protein